MNASIPFLLALCASAAAQAPQPAGAELETKTYVSPIPQRHRIGAALQLLPYAFRSNAALEDELDLILDPGQLLDLLRNLVAPERWEEPGFSLRSDATGRIVATAAPEVHADLARALAFFDAHFGRTQDLAVEVYPIAAGAAIPSEVGGISTAAVSQRFVEELRASKLLGSPRAWTVRATPLSFASGGGSQEHRIVVDLDVEIAQAAAIADPVVDQISIGTQTTLRAAASSGGVWLHLLYEHREFLSPVAAKPVGIYRELSHAETGAFERGVTNYEMQHPRLGFASSASSSFIPSGSELLLVHRAKSPWGENGRLLRLRPLTRQEAPRSLVIGERALSLHDLSPIAPPSVEFGIGGNRFAQRRIGEGEGQGMALFEGVSMGDLVDQLRAALPSEVWDRGFDVQELGGMLLSMGRESDVTAFDAHVTKRVAAETATDSVVVLLQDRSGQETFAQLTLSARSGSRAIFALGAEALAVADFSVEVAQGSSITDPNVASVLHGIAGTLGVARQGDALWIEIDAVLQLLEGDFVPTPQITGLETFVERYSGARARVRENLRLASGESARIGDLDPEGKSGLLLTIVRR